MHSLTPSCKDLRDEGQGCADRAYEDEVVCGICEVPQVRRVNECALGDQRGRQTGIVGEHVRRNDRERLEPVGGGDVGAKAFGGIQVTAV